MTAREFMHRMETDFEFRATPTCAKCKQPLTESVTGNRHTHDGFLDSDCYFDELSTIIEEHPIRTARIRRG